MTDGLLLPPGGGDSIQAMTLKVGAEQAAAWSVFEAVVAPGFDVGAHLHHEAEEMFYVVDGELDLLAFHPADSETGSDWRSWRSEAGAEVLRGGPGSFMHVPAGCPHAFFNPGSEPARMLFIVTPAGHETYLRELTGMLASGPPDPAEITALRARHDIHQLTPLTNRA
ncbi:cupin domain-containing protein [Microbispora sp. CSR-4]|uniref:cupin domain-containing protein n=1 Tax=Microbispora sp. CSR-4 TaxID=2592813 RepID=UPI0011CB3A3E|nr:cupin domain-containing protein [Microbispora sp. CSR-4]